MRKTFSSLMIFFQRESITFVLIYLKAGVLSLDMS